MEDQRREEGENPSRSRRCKSGALKQGWSMKIGHAHQRPLGFVPWEGALNVMMLESENLPVFIHE